jgi:hypothetical protein
MLITRLGKSAQIDLLRSYWMPNKTALNWLVPLIALIAVITAGVGLFSQGGPGPRTFTNTYRQTVELYGKGIYQHDSRLAGAGFRGTDAATLVVALPLLLATYALYRRGSRNAAIVLIGVLFYFMYNGASMTFAAMFNPLFLLYTALFSVSLFAVIVALGSFDRQALAKRVLPGFPHRGMAIFLFITGIATFLLWLSELLGPILTGGAPENLGPYTTMFTHSFDSATITPVAVLIGVFLLRRNPMGYLLAAPLMIFCTLIGVVVIGQTISQALDGLIFPPGVYIGMVGSWILMGAFAVGLTVAYFRNLAA